MNVVLFKTLTLERYIPAFWNDLYSFQVHYFEDNSVVADIYFILSLMFGRSLELFGTSYTGLSNAAVILLFFLNPSLAPHCSLDRVQTVTRPFLLSAVQLPHASFYWTLLSSLKGSCFVFSFTSDMKYLPPPWAINSYSSFRFQEAFPDPHKRCGLLLCFPWWLKALTALNCKCKFGCPCLHDFCSLLYSQCWAS